MIILVTPKEEQGAKKRVILRRKVFYSNFLSSEKTVYEQKVRFLSSGFLFTCGISALILTVLLIAAVSLSAAIS